MTSKQRELLLAARTYIFVARDKFDYKSACEIIDWINDELDEPAEPMISVNDLQAWISQKREDTYQTVGIMNDSGISSSATKSHAHGMLFMLDMLAEKIGGAKCQSGLT